MIHGSKLLDNICMGFVIVCTPVYELVVFGLWVECSVYMNKSSNLV